MIQNKFPLWLVFYKELWKNCRKTILKIRWVGQSPLRTSLPPHQSCCLYRLRQMIKNYLITGVIVYSFYNRLKFVGTGKMEGLGKTTTLDEMYLLKCCLSYVWILFVVGTKLKDKEPPNSTLCCVSPLKYTYGYTHRYIRYNMEVI